jgi:hypothetical protein
MDMGRIKALSFRYVAQQQKPMQQILIFFLEPVPFFKKISDRPHSWFRQILKMTASITEIMLRIFQALGDGHRFHAQAQENSEELPLCALVTAVYAETWHDPRRSRPPVIHDPLPPLADADAGK